MNKTKPENFVSNDNIICHWTDKKNYLFHYRKLNFYDGHGMIVVKVHENVSFKQSKKKN